MDPVSQAALGAIAARSVAPADMAKGVLIAGAALGAAPDLDVVFSIGGDFFDTLRHHRGVTHSLIVLLALGPLAGHWLWRRFGDGLRWRRQHLWWLAVATLALLSHPLLDGLTTYGTQWLAPFSDRRFAVNAMPIIDPVFTLILLGGLAAGIWLKSPRRRKASALAALALSCAYLAYGWAQNREAAQFAAAQLETEGVGDYELSAFPTILQVHYRRIVVRTPSEVRVGYYSTWSPCAIQWGRASRAGAAAASALAATDEGRTFDWFAMGWSFPVVQPLANGFLVTLNDLRYGATLDPRESFFSIGARFDAAWRLLAPPIGRGFSPDQDRLDFKTLFDAAYFSECPSAAAEFTPT
ncbi:MAG: metal-dependent hydrolase [Gammaproteobacteria bacterium]|nr:metal-dependent hydrolase [Gammaproteobacteria bacterium]